MAMRFVDILRATAVLLIAAGLAFPAQAAKATGKKKTGAHGAIAINRDTKVVGYAYDFKTAREAKLEALRQCVQKQCEVVVSFQGGCAAVAGAGKRLATATGVTRDEAETKAAGKCGKDCAALAWACTKDK